MVTFRTANFSYRITFLFSLGLKKTLDRSIETIIATSIAIGSSNSPAEINIFANGGSRGNSTIRAPSRVNFPRSSSAEGPQMKQ